MRGAADSSGAFRRVCAENVSKFGRQSTKVAPESTNTDLSLADSGPTSTKGVPPREAE